MKTGFYAGVFLGIVALSCAVFTLSATAQAPHHDTRGEIASVDVMNGYALKDYAFWQNPEKWHFVTVRYRRDSNELRLIYANDIAWKTLQEGGEYPDGAIFGKIGMITEDDPAFTSSAVPSGARRYQLMVKDKKKWAETDGWGYALFDWRGKAVREDQDIAAQACHACHALVPERDYVFAVPFQLEVGAKAPAPVPAAAARIEFKTVDFAALPEKAREKMPAGFGQARVLQGRIAQNLFRGTIDEIRPALAKEMLLTGLPAALVSPDGSLFSVMYIDPKDKTCKLDSGKDGVTMYSVYTTANFPGKKSIVVKSEHCDDGKQQGAR